MNRGEKEKEIGVCVCWFFLGEHVRRRTRADGEHVPTENACRRRARETPAASSGPTREGKSRLPSLFSLLIWGLCVSVVEALSDKLVLFKCSDCRVVGCIQKIL